MRGSSYDEIGNDTAAAADYLQWLVLTQSRVTDLEALEIGKSLVLDMEAGQIYRIPFEATEGEPIKITALSAGNSARMPSSSCKTRTAIRSSATTTARATSTRQSPSSLSPRTGAIR